MSTSKEVAPDQRAMFEAMLRERSENPARYQASHSFNQKRAAENYGREKAKGKK